MRVHRHRVLVVPDARLQLNPHHGPMIYATLAAAYGLATQSEPMIPDGLLLEAPEQGRTQVDRGDALAFGWTLISVDHRDAHLRFQRMINGLRLLGSRARQANKPLAGGFQLTEVTDAFTDQLLSEERELVGIEISCEALSAMNGEVFDVSVELTTPLRMNRPAEARTAGHEFVDDLWFCAANWLRGLMRRLSEVGLDHLLPAEPLLHGRSVSTLLAAPVLCDASKLVWLDLPYQGTGGAKSLGGVVGRLSLKDVPVAWYPALVWGQLIGVGRNTRMGLGRYRLVNPAPQWTLSTGQSTESLERLSRPLARSSSLLHYALNSAALDRGAARYDLEPGEANQAAYQIRVGEYSPDPPTHFMLHDGDKQPRRMSVPSRRDRALQVAVLETIAPALERYFETSSFAYRSGLGRHSAARRIEQLSGAGLRWAVRSDIHRFFDSVNHDVLEARLRAYLPDEPLVSVLMQWVRSLVDHNASAAIGLPTGAPISPVLANMLLDHFDEQVEADGAKLVRYADDFLLLHRTQEQAVAALQSAAVAAESLRLSLNESKTRVFSPEEVFEFLGFRFERDKDWRFSNTLPPGLIDALGWVDLKSQQTSRSAQLTLPPLPGETQSESIYASKIAIVGSRIDSIDGKPGHLQLKNRADEVVDSLPSRSVGLLLIQKLPTITSSAWFEIMEQHIELLFVDRSGMPLYQTQPPYPPGGLDVRAAQIELLKDSPSSLSVARQLVAAKLINTSHACRSMFDGSDVGLVSEQLRQLSIQARSAIDHSQLMGFEGAGAAAWYGLYGLRLPKQFQFRKRVAPRATDAANALLNAAHVHIHRLCYSAVIAAGLLPDVGVLHRPRSGHAALASDFQEPFRHLADRAVWYACQELSSSDFELQPGSAYPITVRSRAMRKLFEVLYRSLSWSVRAADGSEGTYRDLIFAQARSYRRWLSDRTQPVSTLEHSSR